jgi:hypothetical protein
MKKITLFTLFFLCLLAGTVSAQNSFKFTDKPANEGCFMKGKSFTVEGKLVAEHKHSDEGKSLYFAIKKDKHILITYVELNASQEATSVSYHYFTKEYLEDVEFGNFGGELELSIDNMYSKYKYEEASQHNVKMTNQEVNGTSIRSFKNKKELESFKKMLKN